MNNYNGFYGLYGFVIFSLQEDVRCKSLFFLNTDCTDWTDESGTVHWSKKKSRLAVTAVQLQFYKLKISVKSVLSVVVVFGRLGYWSFGRLGDFRLIREIRVIRVRYLLPSFPSFARLPVAFQGGASRLNTIPKALPWATCLLPFQGVSNRTGRKNSWTINGNYMLKEKRTRIIHIILFNVLMYK